MERVTLWHGTTKRAAQGIVVKGFTPMRTLAVVGDIAQQHGLSAWTVMQAAREAGRFVTMRKGRDGFAWFTSDRAVAEGSWAQRAPEVLYDALWAVWLATHGGLDPRGPWNEPAAAAWHASHMFSITPTVLEVSLPLDVVLDRYQQALSPGQASLLKTGELPQACVACPVPAEWVVSVHEIERRVDPVAVAGLLGITEGDLIDIVDAGEFPKHRSSEPPWKVPYWTFEDLRAHSLTDQLPRCCEPLQL